VEDRIALTLGGDDELLAAARAHEEYVSGETLATALDLVDGVDRGPHGLLYGPRGRRPNATVDGRDLWIWLERV
jgi:hypothetical protein